MLVVEFAVLANLNKDLYMMRLFYLLLLVWFTSCEKDVNLNRISLKFDNNTEILIDSANVIELETSENSLLYDIGHIEILGNKYFVLSRNLVCVFDLQGKFLFNLSRKGEAPNEYLSLHNMFSDNNMIYLYDFLSTRILKFNSDGKYMSDIKITRKGDYPTPAKVYFVDDNTFLGYNSYSGNEIEVSVFSFWNKELSRYYYVKGRSLQSGLRFSDGCFIDQNKRVLYWEPAKDTLFCIKNNCLEPLYHIDFGIHAIPNTIAAKDDYERVMFLGKKENYKYASLARFYQVENNVLYFSCIYNEKVYICSYNEETGDTDIFSFISLDNHYKALSFFKIIDNYVILELQDNTDTEKNHLLYKFSINEFKKKEN